MYSPNNTDFDEFGEYCTSCKVDISIFHRNNDRISVVIHRTCCTDPDSEVVVTQKVIKFPDGLDSLWPRPPGQSRRQSTQTFNQLTFRDLLAKSGLSCGVFSTDQICAWITQNLFAIDARKSRQKISRKGEVHCSEKSTRHSQTSAQTIEVCDFTALAVHAQLSVRYVSVCS